MGCQPNCVLGWREDAYAGRNPRWSREYGQFSMEIRRSTRKPKDWEYCIDGATYWTTFSPSSTTTTMAQTEAHAIMRERLVDALGSLEAPQ